MTATTPPTDEELYDAHSDPVAVAMWNAQPTLPDGESYFSAATKVAGTTMTITVSETVVTTYEVTEADLSKLSLPFDTEELEDRDGDYIATSLSEGHSPTSESVTERTLEFDITE